MKKNLFRLFTVTFFTLMMTMLSAFALDASDYSGVARASDDTIVLSYEREQISDDIVLEKVVETSALVPYAAGITGDKYISHNYRTKSTNELVAKIKLTCNFRYSDTADPVYCKFQTEPKVTITIKNPKASLVVTEEKKENNKSGLVTQSHFSRATVDYKFTAPLAEKIVNDTLWMKCTQSGKVTSSED